MGKFTDKYKNPICDSNQIIIPKSPELEQLYKERDEKFKEYTEIQKKINDTILNTAMKGMSDLTGHYVKIIENESEEYWILVKIVERLYNGVRLIGSGLDIYNDPIENQIIVRIDNEWHYVVKSGEFEKVKEVSKDAFMTKWNKCIETFNKSLEPNAA